MKSHVLPVSTTELERDTAEANAARIEGVYKTAHKNLAVPEMPARVNRRESKRRLAEISHEKQEPIPEGTVGEALALRRRILSMSLFPNPLGHMKLSYE